MSIMDRAGAKLAELKEDKQFENDRKKMATMLKKLLFWLFRFVMIVGIAYVILGPLISIVSKSFFSDADQYNNMVFVIPQSPTLERYKIAWGYMKYLNVLKNTMIYVILILIINVIICSMVGYGFARFQFPCKKLLFALVIVMIVIPTHTIMLPLYVTFRKFDVFGIITAINGSPINLLQSTTPMYIMSLFGCGLRSGLYIYIFNQFFRGLPKEIEEAAFVDGAGMFYTYFRIMLINAMPSVITVAIFSLVWQYNDTFYARLFGISTKTVLSMNIASLQSTVANALSLSDPNISVLYLDAGMVLVILPVLLIYVILQKQFIEGVERSGIVG